MSGIKVSFGRCAGCNNPRPLAHGGDGKGRCFSCLHGTMEHWSMNLQFLEAAERNYDSGRAAEARRQKLDTGKMLDRLLDLKESEDDEQ